MAQVVQIVQMAQIVSMQKQQAAKNQPNMTLNLYQCK